MKRFTIAVLSASAMLFSFSNPGNLPLKGTWRLISGTTINKKDTVVTDYTKGQKMLKIINDTHFAFLRHDLSKGKDTAIYDGGGGTYTLKGNQYTENLEYCSYRPWEGRSFHFTVSIKGDTLVQSGVEKLEDLGVDRFIIERYVRVK
ncbi:lipocalin family protein [Pseudoflavitalea sp. G-6-1-2]|uniref:lipocalin family protein n=1 Tax=Pseudoflavitalea sp. G-6-1-2 TaxID=2728841 RepID=UPI00146EC80A|nr:lipocalin family protein [Pseudoflavitalea sp. G-6-1-2]NML23876.1 lipocalin family protein [Pseudoflavitalea sp. G-6-1-2]